MPQTTHEQDEPNKASKVSGHLTRRDPEDDPGKRPREIGGFALAVFGALVTVGIIILPASTLEEKLLITCAAIALSISCAAGFGAWRSVRRFATVAASAGVALVCLAALSVAAASTSAASKPEVSISPLPGSPNGNTPDSTPDIESTTPVLPTPPISNSPIPSPSAYQTASTGAPISLALVNIPPVGGAAEASLSTGPQKVDAVQYSQTLYDTEYDNTCGLTDSTTYEIDRKYRHFHAVVGLADSSPSGDAVNFSILVDGQLKGPSPILTVGETSTFDVVITGAFRITLQEKCSLGVGNPGEEDVTAVWINPVVTG